MRHDNRKQDQLRSFSLERGYAKFAEGSCFVKIGDTHMLVTATVEEVIPRFKKGHGEGWVTAEYSMLARSGRERNSRDPMRPNGRSMEIQRLIGRAMRSVTDLKMLGERTITVDCDAIRADGGTRCAAITGAYVAIYDAMRWLIDRRMIKTIALREPIAAISVGIVNGQNMLDLDYQEDSNAETDMNVVMTGSNRFVEIQGTAEIEPFSSEALGQMLALGRKGCQELMAAQKAILEI